MVRFGLLMLVGAFFFGGCAKTVEANKPAIYWYQQMADSIAFGALDKAGDAFSSLRSEHVHSPLIPEALLMLAQAHMEKEEYLLANFYLDSYIQRYATKANIDFAKFLKLKANYMAFKVPNRDQKLLLETIDKAGTFQATMADSPFAPYAATIVTTLNVAKGAMDREIAELYARIDKPEASEIYIRRADAEKPESIDVKPPRVFWLRALFE